MGTNPAAPALGVWPWGGDLKKSDPKHPKPVGGRQEGVPAQRPPHGKWESSACRCSFPFTLQHTDGPGGECSIPPVFMYLWKTLYLSAPRAGEGAWVGRGQLGLAPAGNQNNSPSLKKTPTRKINNNNSNINPTVKYPTAGAARGVLLGGARAEPPAPSAPRWDPGTVRGVLPAAPSD